MRVYLITVRVKLRSEGISDNKIKLRSEGISDNKIKLRSEGISDNSESKTKE